MNIKIFMYNSCLNTCFDFHDCYAINDHCINKEPCKEYKNTYHQAISIINSFCKTEKQCLLFGLCSTPCDDMLSILREPPFNDEVY